eukprot:g19435.t1
MNAIYKFAVDTTVAGKGGEHAPIYINRTEVETVESIKFLRVTITENLFWTSHIDATVKKTQQRLFFLRCTIESILSGCITAWYGNCSVLDHKKLQKMVCTAQTIAEANLPSMDSTYTACCHGNAANIIKDPSHP